MSLVWLLIMIAVNWSLSALINLLPEAVPLHLPNWGTWLIIGLLVSWLMGTSPH
ncbi:hypothetical protein XM38_044090 [Halomicronema hongdechloris C2206]|uniref:Uncharacterized protein n=1 Tax=Halomicronema hongdechloris C2206 TaxID=1641165 RepID=A0A1Z3HT66_9CYAN|nr:hypothetical protein XM38_044090 [Halomicronema hongdechloris C2206]